VNSTIAGAGDEKIVANDGNGVDPRIIGEDSKTGAGLQVSQPERLVIKRAREDAAPVRQHRDRANPTLMALEAAKLSAGLQVP
jgi:hypothetical protein